MKLFTPRTLIAYGERPGSLTQPRIDFAVHRLAFDGWVLAYHPTVEEPERPVAAEQQHRRIAELMQLTHDASRRGRFRPAKVAVDVVALALDQPFGTAEAMEALARRGLAVVQVEQDRVGLVGTSPALARIVNTLRLGRPPRGGRCSYRLVQAALGLAERPKRLSAPRLLLADEMFKRYRVEASDLLHGRRRTHLRSPWILNEALLSQVAA